MEEDIRRQGTLHLHQQRFGKRWKRVWCVLFRESSRSVSRLEFFDCKDGVTVEKSRRQQENKKSHLEPLGDKVLTGVKSLTLETRSVPRKNQVKTISSCPLPHQKPPGPLEHSRPPEHPGSGHDPDQTYSRTAPPEPEYSLPFDTIASAIMSDILDPCRAIGAEAIADPLYDSIDEMKIRNVFLSAGAGPVGGKAEHIYDEPEGCAAPPPPSATYDDLEEMRGDAWRLMGTAADPKGYEYPYDPRVDDYAVPKRAQRVLPVAQSTSEEEDGEKEPREEDQEEHCEPPYSNVRKKKV
ncbi:Docking protein 2 [Liparis tanakae]|uniref:Docking protein 2 n=1 Tax=Liparis tanakae TaxID=230148 RepID=A0A4Z2FBB1_9TELE|nr:Docking protein 2 [Liparis tanakae]